MMRMAMINGMIRCMARNQLAENFLHLTRQNPNGRVTTKVRTIRTSRSPVEPYDRSMTNACSRA